MSNFGSDVTVAPQANSAETPKAGVVTQSPTLPVSRAGLLDSFSLAQDAVDEFGKGVNDKKLASFNREILKIADSYEQGGIKSSSEANARIRMKLMEALDSTDNIELQNQYIEAQRSLMGLQGGAAIVNKRTDEEARRKALRDGMVASHILPSDASEGEFAQKEQDLIAAQNAASEFKARNDAIDAELKDISLTNARRGVLNAQKSENAVKYFNTAVGPTRDGMQAEFENILNSDMTEVEKKVAIETFYNNFLTQVGPMATSLTADQRTMYTKPFERTRDLYVDLALGTTTRAAAENKIASINATTKALILSDPGLASLAAANDLFGNFDVSGEMSVEVTRRFIEMFGGNLAPSNADLPPGIGTGADLFNTQQDADAAKMVMNLAANNVSDPALTDDALMQFDSILGRMVNSEPTARNDAKKAIPMIEAFANPRYGDFIIKHGSEMQNLDEAKRVVQENFVDEVLGMVRKEFKESKVLDPAVLDAIANDNKPRQLIGEGAKQVALPPNVEQPTPDSVTYRSTATGVEFIPVDANNPMALKKAKDLNKGLGRAINQSVAAFAHLNGTKDYQSVWENIAKDVLGTDPLPSNAADPDQLEVKDFLSKLGSVSPASPKEIDSSFVGKLSGPGFNNGKTMDRVEGMIIHHTGGRGTVEGVAKTLEDRGLSVQYVVDRKGKIHQFMPDNAVAFHAGAHNTSGFDNENTIGVEVIGNDNKDILGVQVQATKKLIKMLSEKYDFDPTSSVFGHGQVSSNKQEDEGMAIVSALK